MIVQRAAPNRCTAALAVSRRLLNLSDNLCYFGWLLDKTDGLECLDERSRREEGA